MDFNLRATQLWNFKLKHVIYDPELFGLLKISIPRCCGKFLPGYFHLHLPALYLFLTHHIYRTVDAVTFYGSV